jgi:hypothetical protein
MPGIAVNQRQRQLVFRFPQATTAIQTNFNATLVPPAQLLLRAAPRRQTVIIQKILDSPTQGADSGCLLVMMQK